MQVSTTCAYGLFSCIPFQLFVPGGRIYGLTDTIPFHVQLTGPVSSLRELVNAQLSDLNRISSADTVVSTRPAHGDLQECQSPIRVFLLRQVCIETRGDKAWRDQILGEGKIWAVPPAVPSYYASSCETREESLDWEGELKVPDSIKTGSFNIGSIVVKDFIVLSVTPLNPPVSALLEMQQTVSIRLVTDSWVDVTGPEER
ncbi:hypothetical protein AX16_005352 [Volvariella volvacea WC 439]|nr:hypothetical protein AX16_005352 [Volvariella volvacea WC 439]